MRERERERQTKRELIKGKEEKEIDERELTTIRPKQKKKNGEVERELRFIVSIMSWCRSILKKTKGENV